MAEEGSRIVRRSAERISEPELLPGSLRRNGILRRAAQNSGIRHRFRPEKPDSVHLAEKRGIVPGQSNWRSHIRSPKEGKP